jgi:peptidase YpeB-like protein
MRIVMNWKAGVYTLAAVVMLAAGPAWAGCSATDRIDGTTADMAKHKIEAAGYDHVTGLSKGCDNYWHAIAMKGGASVGVVVSPTGEVMTEGS